MQSHRNRTQRRNFIKGSAAAIAGIPIAVVLPASATELPPIDENSASAKALAYVHDTTKVDSARFANWGAKQNCAGCRLYTGASGKSWGPCAIFPGKAVNASGWCSAWVAKA